MNSIKQKGALTSIRSDGSPYKNLSNATKISKYFLAQGAGVLRTFTF